MKSLAQKRALVDKNHNILSLRRQCQILSLHRSVLYYKPATESELNLELMRLIDEHYLRHPYKGAKRMHTWLRLDKGFKVSINRVSRLYYNVLGLRSILPGPSTSTPKKGAGHKVFPYLLRGLKIEKPNQAWAMDITYIPMQGGFIYLVTVIDLYSRYVPSWSVSNTMTAEWCQDTLEQAIVSYGCPCILNTDQGSQFTSHDFTEYVLSAEIKMSMDGKRRCIDNVFIERLWWSVKYEDVYIRSYADGWELEQGLASYFSYYNNYRRHQSLENDRPSDRFFLPSSPIIQLAKERMEGKI